MEIYIWLLSEIQKLYLHDDTKYDVIFFFYTVVTTAHVAINYRAFIWHSMGIVRKYTYVSLHGKKPSYHIV